MNRLYATLCCCAGAAASALVRDPLPLYAAVLLCVVLVFFAPRCRT